MCFAAEECWCDDTHVPHVTLNVGTMSSEREVYFIVNRPPSYMEQRIENKSWFEIRHIFLGMDMTGWSEEVNREICGMPQPFLGGQKCEILYTHLSMMYYMMNSPEGHSQGWHSIWPHQWVKIFMKETERNKGNEAIAHRWVPVTYHWLHLLRLCGLLMWHLHLSELCFFTAQKKLILSYLFKMWSK